MRRHLHLAAVLASLGSFALIACGDGDVKTPSTNPESDPGAGYFESSASANYGSRGDGSLAAGGATGGVDLGAPPKGENGAAVREIQEADIIQLQGTRLYAMSRTGGLSVIDVSNPSALKILGRYRTSFTPFEMYIEGNVVYAMYSDWGQFAQDPTTKEWGWKQSSSLLALDVSTPSKIQKLSQFELPGEISDSRMVGDVLYTVTYQDGYCWGCAANKPATVVTSVNVAKAAAPAKVGELAFSTDNQYGWGKRSIAVNTQRIYIGGPEYGTEQPENSTIQVVDISDPKGKLVAGTSFKVKGQITNRWQMDEFEGTFRVISQPWTWWQGSAAPSIETFAVKSSQLVEPLARVDMVIPERDTLRSVRFDGERAYAVTAEQKDPLFTIDLSNPLAPKQVGELKIPGYLEHMEPRGDRLVALGFDQGNPEGSITVSIFDVSDMTKPTQLQRVNFGGDWGSLPEDQDRIHKVFKLDAAAGLITVPFSGWKNTNDGDWCGQSLNGVQLIDWKSDSLKLRGATKSLGQARRAFLSNGTLFTVAEQEVGAYDISNRDAPKELSTAPLALNVSMTLPAGDKVVRLRQDWYSADMRLEVVPSAAPDVLVAPVTFNLTDYLRSKHGLKACSYWYPSNEPMFVVGDTVWTLINDYGQWDYGYGYSKSRSLLVGFSATTGKVTGSLEIPFQAGYWGWGDTSRVVRGSSVLLMQSGWEQDAVSRSLVTLDLSNPAAPKIGNQLGLPTTDYYGNTGLLESGNQLVTSYAQSVAGKENVVRHFALRLDITDLLQPKLLDATNIPGYVVDFDAATGRVVTLDHVNDAIPGVSWEDCQLRFPNSWFDQQTAKCNGYHSTMRKVALEGGRARVEASVTKDELAWMTPRRGEGRLFFSGYGGYYYGVADGGWYGGWSWASQKVTVVDSTTLAVGVVDAPGVWNVVPNGKQLILAPSAGQPLSVVDGTDASNPVVRTGKETALSYTNHLAVDGNSVLLSQGDGGVQRLTLPSLQ